MRLSRDWLPVKIVLKCRFRLKRTQVHVTHVIERFSLSFEMSVYENRIDV